MDRQVQCPKCQHRFAVSDAAPRSSIPCPECGFETPTPLASAAVAQGSGTTFVRGLFAFMLLFAGIAVLACGFPLTLTVALSESSHSSARPKDFLTAEAMLVSAFTFIGCAVYLMRRGSARVRPYAALTQKAALILAMTLLLGAAAFVFAFVNCLG
jgi:hypothetical protein